MKNVGGLPRPRKEDMVYDEGREEEIQRKEEMKEQREEAQATTVCKLIVPNKPDKNLGVITEDEEVEGQGETEFTGNQLVFYITVVNFDQR